MQLYLTVILSTQLVVYYYQCWTMLAYASNWQGGDSAAGTQALPVGKISHAKVCRKDNQKGIVNLHRLKDI